MTQVGPGATACLVCGAMTANPRFCSRSCAAKYNNKISPKRQPEGKCSECGQATSASKSLCPQCREKRRQAQLQEKDRKSKNIKSWRAFDGALKEEPILGTGTHKVVTFESRLSDYSRGLQVNDSSGRLIDELLGLCFARPEYLRPNDARRHVVLLNELRKFPIERDPWSAAPKRVKVADLPISQLSHALEKWIFSFFDERYSPVMPSYALDTARFVQFHIEGFSDYEPEHWRIEPLVRDRSERHDLIRFVDSRFKREFTQSMGTLYLNATVPENCSIVDGQRNEVLAAGSEFLFNAERCHLSSGVYDHYVGFTCREGDSPRFDLHREFRFMGAAFFLKDSAPIKFATKSDLTDSIEPNFAGLKMELPAYWIESVSSS